MSVESVPDSFGWFFLTCRHGPVCTAELLYTHVPPGTALSVTPSEEPKT